MTLQDFISKYTNQFIDYDKSYGNQCVDLINQYCQEVLGIQNPIGELPGDTAYDIYQNYQGQLFDKIANTPTGVPSAGDIPFWDTSIGSAGHVDLFISGDQNSFNGFDQNWPVGSPCHVQTHSYGGVVGWLHPKNAPISNDALTECLKQHDDLVNQCNTKDQQIADLQKKADNLQQQLTDCQDKPPSTVTVQLPISGTVTSTTPSPVIETMLKLDGPTDQPNLDVPTNPSTVPNSPNNWISTFFHWLFNK